MAAIQSRDRAAPPPGAPAGGADDLEQLFEEHHARVFRTAYRVTGSESDAEDVLQTVFFRLLRREDRPELDAGAAAYFHRAAVNASLDLIRSRKRSRAVALDDVAGTLPEAEAHGPEARRGAGEIKSWLRQALTRLSPQAAEIFVLRYIEGYGNLEIAELLGSSQNAIGVSLHRSRNKLQKELEPLFGGTS